MNIKRQTIKQLNLSRYNLEASRRELQLLHDKQVKLKKQLASVIKVRQERFKQSALLNATVVKIIQDLEINSELSKQNKEALTQHLRSFLQHSSYDVIPELQSSLARNSNKIKQIHSNHRELKLKIGNLKEILGIKK